jgi:hypothetical protein
MDRPRGGRGCRRPQARPHLLVRELPDAPCHASSSGPDRLLCVFLPVQGVSAPFEQARQAFTEHQCDRLKTGFALS